MFKVSSFATLLAVALSLMAGSCAGPVFFKPPAASVATTAPAAPGQNVALAAAPAAAAVAGSASPAPSAAAPSTQPSTSPPVLAYLTAMPMNGATIFALCTASLFITIVFLNLVFGDSTAGQRPK